MSKSTPDGRMEDGLGREKQARMGSHSHSSLSRGEREVAGTTSAPSLLLRPHPVVAASAQRESQPKNRSGAMDRECAGVGLKGCSPKDQQTTGRKSAHTTSVRCKYG